MPYATCSIVQAHNQQQIVTRFASDIDGKFVGEIKTPGNYVLIVSFIGKQAAQRSFTIDSKNTHVQLGKVGLSSSKQALKELNVVAMRPLIKADVDKISYDTEQDPESK